MKVRPKMPLDWEKILAEIPVERREAVQKTVEEDYLDVVTTNWPLVEDEPSDGRGGKYHRVIRFKADPMTRWLVDVALAPRRGIGLSDMCAAMQNGVGGTWSRRKIEDFYRGMGYSLCGFAEVFRMGETNWKTR